MKIFITFLCMIVSLTVVTAANADPTAVTVYDSYESGGKKAWSPTADFILFNNTSSNLHLDSFVIPAWPHPGMQKSTLPPFSTLVDADMDMASSANNEPGARLVITGDFDISTMRTMLTSTQVQDRKTGSYTTNWTMQSMGIPPSPLVGSPPLITNSSTYSQQSDTKFTYTLIATPNLDKTDGKFTGNTKIILVVTDYNAQDWKSFPYTPITP